MKLLDNLLLRIFYSFMKFQPGVLTTQSLNTLSSRDCTLKLPCFECCGLIYERNKMLRYQIFICSKTQLASIKRTNFHEFPILGLNQNKSLIFCTVQNEPCLLLLLCYCRINVSENFHQSAVNVYFLL